MQSSKHIIFATPFPATVQPHHLLGRLVVDPQLSVTTISAQLNPSPTQVEVQAQILHSPYNMNAGLQAQKHVFAPGPARVWNAMLANERSMPAILSVFTQSQQAWLVTAAYTVNGAVVALDYERVRFRDEKFIIELDDPCEYCLEHWRLDDLFEFVNDISRSYILSGA